MDTDFTFTLGRAGSPLPAVDPNFLGGAHEVTRPTGWHLHFIRVYLC
jgi:hypothetical protein